MSGAAASWAAALAAWALPQELLDAAPADPWSLAPGDFAARAAAARERRTPADEAARAALPRRGSVLDVGCGAGAGSAPLWDRAGVVTGVDGSDAMLAAFREQLTTSPGGLARLRRRPRVATVEGAWPDVADAAPVADVVVAHDVLYNVGEDVAAFVEQLTAHARAAVVVVLPERHPRSWLAPYFEQLHGLARPARPTADMAADVVRATGPRPRVERWDEPVQRPGGQALVERVATATCTPPERLGEVRAALERVPPPTTRRMVSLVWGGGA